MREGWMGGLLCVVATLTRRYFFFLVLKKEIATSFINKDIMKLGTLIVWH